MIKRRAPKDGYDNDVKRRYRHEVWSRLSKRCLPILKENDNAKVLMMPSKEGLEIDVAMEYDIKSEQIICIDENPALLAHAKWKDKIPKENRHGVKVSRIAEIIKDKGWILAGANLDFCNQISEELINETNNFLEGCPIVDNFSFFVTFMRGRESKALHLLLKKRKAVKIFKSDRLAAFYEMVDWPIINSHYWACKYEDIYNGSSPMLYAMFSSINGRITSDKIEHNIDRLEVLGERMHNISSCKTGINGNYRDKAEKVHRIKNKTEEEILKLLRDIRIEKERYGIEESIIETGQYNKDHKPELYFNCEPHYSGFCFNRGNGKLFN